jgi:hypothetical protein
MENNIKQLAALAKLYIFIICDKISEVDPYTLRMSDLAPLVGIYTNQLTKEVNLLCEFGILIKKQSVTDKRVTLLSINADKYKKFKDAIGLLEDVFTPSA